MFSGYFNGLFFDGYFPQWWPRNLEFDGFVPVGRYEVKGLKVDGEKAVFQLSELKRRLDVKLPKRIVTKEEFPNAPESSLGRRLTVVYGQVDRVPCFCLDTTTRTFAATGHAFNRLRGVYVGGVRVAVESIDAAAGTFTLATYEDGQEVEADVDGKPGTNGLMVNGARQVFDLLTTEAGEAADLIDAASFEEAFDSWNLGTDIYGEEVARLEPAFAVTDETSVAELIELICRATFGLVYVGHDGLYKMRAWEARRPVDVLNLIDADVEELAPELDRDAVVTRIVATYRNRAGGGQGVTYILEDEAARLENGLTEHRELVEKELPFYRARCAEAWTSRALAMRSRPKRVYALGTNQAALLLEPGDTLSIRATVFDSMGREVERLRGIFDVLEVSRDPMGGPVDLLLSDLRGLPRPLLVMSEADTMPDGTSAEEYNPAWSEEFKRYALENFGYISDEFETVDPTDPATWRASCIT